MAVSELLGDIEEKIQFVETNDHQASSSVLSEQSCPPYQSGSPPPTYEEVMREEGEVNSWFTICSRATSEMEKSEKKEEEPSLCISKEEATAALKKFVRKSYCYGRSRPKHMKISRLESYCAYKYVLQTFYEERSISWEQEPYTDKSIIDSYECQLPPIWEVQVQTPRWFHETEIQQEVPHTTTIDLCTDCEGDGVTECKVCKGAGNVECEVCDGLGLMLPHNFQDDFTGSDKNEMYAPYHCVSCGGGRTSCEQCFAEGRIQCETCVGNCRMKKFCVLTVKWKVLTTEQVFSAVDLPDLCVTSVSGATVFEEQNTNVGSSSDFPNEDVINYSQMMIAIHNDQVSHGEILMQRHHIEEIPIAEVLTTWKGKEFKYYVYGLEHHVLCPDYPLRCSIV